jgi:hypothetical protein
MQPAYSAAIIQKIPYLFKRNISIGKGISIAYRTMILQVPHTKRVTAAMFFEKN